jgi:hypothetical protein
MGFPPLIDPTVSDEENKVGSDDGTNDASGER